MKTRNLLVAMALPTLFAACTAEEIVNQADNNVLETRALLGDLSVKIENPVASRVAWSDETLKWGDLEDDDVFSSAVVDATRGWDNVGNSLLTNYIWKKNAAGEWSTTSQMVEGIYSFYSYKGIATKNDRDAVKFDLTAQTTDLDDPTKVINDNQLFFSPLYNIEAKNTTAENTVPLDLTFYPYHSIAAFKMTNTTGQTLLISQIITEGEFAAKGAIMPKQIKAAGLMWNVRKNESVYKLDAKEWNTDGTAKTEYTANEIKEMWQESDLDNIGTASGELALSEVLAMNCGNYEWEDGEELIAYMVMPANAKIDAVKINVVDEEGEAKYVEVVERAENKDQDNEVDGKQLQISSTGLEDIEFKRSVPVSVFGYTSAGAPKTITVKEANLISNNGYYIDNKEDLEKLVNVSRGDIKVYNFGELVVDAEVAEIIAEYTGGIVTFNNPIDIKDTEEVKISNINFGVATVKGKDEETGFEGTTVVFEDATAADLTIEAGATVTIKGGTYKKVVNNGTLSVEANVNPSKFENNATMSVCDYIVLDSRATYGHHSITLNKGTLNYVGYDADEDGTVEDGEEYNTYLPEINPADSYSITYDEHVNLNVNLTDKNIQAYTGKTGSLTVNGNFNLTGAMTIGQRVTLTIADDEIEGAGSIIIDGTVTNGGETDVKFTVNNGATLNNNGEAVVVKNDGTVKTGEGSVTTVETGAGRVDNSAGAQVNNDANQTVFYLVENKTIEDLESILFKRYAVNTLRVKGTLTLDRAFDDKANWAQLQSLKTLELVDDAEVKIDGKVVVDIKEVKVLGDATISGWSKEESSLTFADGATVTLTKKSVSSTATNPKGYELKYKNVTVSGITMNDEYMEETHAAATGYVHVKPTINSEKDAALDAIDGNSAQVATEAGLTAAIKNADVENITLSKDLTLESGLDLTSVQGRSADAAPAKTPLTIDLNGYTLYSKAKKNGWITSSGKLTIKNGYISSDGTAVWAKGGELNLMNCKITERGTTGGDAVYVSDNAKVVVRGGWIEAVGKNEDEDDVWYGVGIAGGDVTLNTVVKGTFHGGVTVTKYSVANFEGGEYTGAYWHGLNINASDVKVNLKNKPIFEGKRGDIQFYQVNGTVNEVAFEAGIYTSEGMYEKLEKTEDEKK